MGMKSSVDQSHPTGPSKCPQSTFKKNHSLRHPPMSLKVKKDCVAKTNCKRVLVPLFDRALDARLPIKVQQWNTYHLRSLHLNKRVIKMQHEFAGKLTVLSYLLRHLETKSSFQTCFFVLLDRSRRRSWRPATKLSETRQEKVSFFREQRRFYLVLLGRAFTKAIKLSCLTAFWKKSFNNAAKRALIHYEACTIDDRHFF